MAQQKIDALILSGGTSLVYFTNIRWGDSERLFAVRHSAQGATVLRLPRVRGGSRARADRARPVRRRHTDVRTWQEDESPFERVAQGLKDRGIATGTHRRRGDRRSSCSPTASPAAAPQLKVVSATPVTAGCRMIKDAHELELMRLASAGDAEGATRRSIKALQPGMTQNDVSAA